MRTYALLSFQFDRGRHPTIREPTCRLSIQGVSWFCYQSSRIPLKCVISLLKLNFQSLIFHRMCLILTSLFKNTKPVKKTKIFQLSKAYRAVTDLIGWSLFPDFTTKFKRVAQCSLLISFSYGIKTKPFISTEVTFRMRNIHKSFTVQASPKLRSDDDSSEEKK